MSHSSKSPPSPTCPNCGNERSADPMHEDCSYCRLQLGLSIATRNQSGSTFANEIEQADEFLRQGVLRQFGQYRLEREIARGGMGVVYLARQESLNRAVAIKLILAGQLATQESIQRFRLEAESAARLRHPGIVRIFEIGEHDSQHFFSMEYIDGVSLAACIEEFRLQEFGTTAARRDQARCIAELLMSVARSLEFAHQHGVLHRDLKPSNILIDSEGCSHLTDFGLAKLTGHEANRLTLSTAVMGTPSYISPEQAAGQTDSVSTAVDVYGLGAVLYELLTGSPPFVGASVIETMWMAIEQPPKPPRQLNPVVPRDLETIALRCLEKEPSHRYASAAAVADELQRFILGQPIHARPIGPIEVGWKWCRRNPWLSSTASAFVLSLLLGTSVALWQWYRIELVNESLRTNLTELELSAIDSALQQGHARRALASIASLIRRGSSDWQAPMFAISILERNRFPVPAIVPLRHPSGDELTLARANPNGTQVLTASFDKTARIWNVFDPTANPPPLIHHSDVISAEFSPSGNLLATGTRDGLLFLWNTSRGDLIDDLDPQQGAIRQLEFDTSGDSLIVRTDASITVLDVSTGQQRFPSSMDTNSLTTSHFLADGTTFYGFKRDTNQSLIRVWNSLSGEEVSRLATAPLRSAQLSPDGQRIAAVDLAGTCWVADYPSLSHRQVITASRETQKLIFDPSGRRVAAVGIVHWTRVWDAQSGLPVTPRLRHNFMLADVAFVDEGERLLTWGYDSTAKLWQLPTGELYAEPMRHTHRVLHAEQMLQGNMVLTALSHLKSRSSDTQTGSAQVWRIPANIENGKQFRTLEQVGHDGNRISPDGRWVAIGKTSGHVLVFDHASGNPICEPLPVHGGAWGIHFTPDSRRMITTTSKGQVAIWSMPDGKLIGESVELNTAIQPSEMSRDGRYLVTGSTDGVMRVWDTATGQPIREMRHGSEINSVAFSPNGRYVASAGEDWFVRIWDTVSGTHHQTLGGHRNEVMKVIFSPNGNQIATASLDFTARIWDVAHGTLISVLPHQGDVVDADYHPDGRLLVTASRDRTAVIWDAQTGLPHSSSLLHEFGVNCVRFSPTGKLLATMDFGGLRVWDVETGHAVTTRLPSDMHGAMGFQSSSMGIAFFPDGDEILVASDNREAKAWPLSIPPTKAPDWFPDFLEAIAGQRVNDSTANQELVEPEHFLKLKEKLAANMPDDFYTRWARRWLNRVDTTADASPIP